MTVGEKIKYIRKLRNMTQKELGIKSGFSTSTADNRIRQYERGRMIPKKDKLKDIANALSVPVESLNNIVIDHDNSSALFNILFELERKGYLKLKKLDNQIVMTFDSSEPLGAYYNEGMKIWYNARMEHFPTEDSINNEENELKYQIWTQEFSWLRRQ